MDGEFRDEADGVLPAFCAGARVAGYRLEERIGTGGMAVVFRARDERLDRPVALKILSPALAADEAFRHRFIRESRAAAAVDDPHIIPVFEAGEADGVLFIAMRYVPGGDVRALMRQLGSLPAVRAAAIIWSVASALDAAHAAGLVHRDVKPANMLVDARAGPARSRVPVGFRAEQGRDWRRARPGRGSSWAPRTTRRRSRWPAIGSTGGPTSTRWPARRSSCSAASRRSGASRSPR